MQITTCHTNLSKTGGLYCRRTKSRLKLQPSRVTCWSGRSRPRSVTLVEADSRGARMVLPSRTRVGDVLQVSFADEMGFCQTRRARVAWTQPFAALDRVMAGLAFEEEMLAA